MLRGFPRPNHVHISQDRMMDVDIVTVIGDFWYLLKYGIKHGIMHGEDLQLKAYDKSTVVDGTWLYATERIIIVTILYRSVCICVRHCYSILWDITDKY